MHHVRCNARSVLFCEDITWQAASFVAWGSVLHAHGFFTLHAHAVPSHAALDLRIPVLRPGLSSRSVQQHPGEYSTLGTGGRQLALTTVDGSELDCLKNIRVSQKPLRSSTATARAFYIHPASIVKHDTLAQFSVTQTHRGCISSKGSQQPGHAGQ